jgi:hypothetical protein
MALSSLQKAAENIEGNVMGAFIDDGGTMRSFGHLLDVSIDFSAVNQDADVAGRQKQIAVDVEASLVMEQTTNTEFDALADVAQPTGKGHVIKLTKEKVSASNASSTSGYKLQYVFPSFSGEFDGSGEGSNFTIQVEGRALIDDVRDPSTIAFDA